MKKHSQPSDLSSVQRLTDAAERLFGLHGLDGVSLREISLAAGYGNNYAVQYHFGSAAGLIRAILKRRMPEVESHRAELLSKIKQEGRLGDTRALMDVVYLPLIERRDERGERSYARFILALQNASAEVQYVGEHLNLMPIAAHVLDLLQAAHPAVPPALLRERQRLISIMVFTSIFNRHEPYTELLYDAALIENVLNMATAALVAPMGHGSRQVLVQARKS